MAISKIQSDSINDSAITADQIAAGAVTASDMADNSITVNKLHTQVQGALGTRNLIINGDMRIAQRGTSATGQSGYIAVDRFRCTGGSDAVDELSLTHAQVTDAPNGFGNSYKITVSTPETTLAADEMIRIEHRMEGQNLQHLKKGTSNAEAMTLSFWIKGSVTGTYIVNIHDSDNGRTIAKSYTINSANTWEYKTITFVGDTTGALDNDNAQSLSVYWYLGAGANWTSGTLGTSWSTFTKANAAVGQTNILTTSSATWQITGVQLEVGDTATLFEHVPYDVQLQRCMRYYEQMNQDYPGIAAGTKGPASGYSVFFKVQKRATPSMSDVTLRNGQNGNTVTVAASGSGWTHENAARYATNGTTGNTGDGVHIYSANGIQADAEL